MYVVVAIYIQYTLRNPIRCATKYQFLYLLEILVAEEAPEFSFIIVRQGDFFEVGAARKTEVGNCFVIAWFDSTRHERLEGEGLQHLKLRKEDLAKGVNVRV